MSAEPSKAAEHVAAARFAEFLSADCADGDREPLSLFTRTIPTPAAFADAHCVYFEYASRGDRCINGIAATFHDLDRGQCGARMSGSSHCIVGINGRASG